MMAPPNRVLATLVLIAASLVGFLVIAAVAVVVLSVGAWELSARTIRCFFSPLSSLDTVVHASAAAFSALAVLPVLIGLHTARRLRAGVVALRRATVAARSRPPARVVAAAAATGVIYYVDVVDTPALLAFAYGWARPRVCISTGLVDRLTDTELEAVLRHEGWHVAHRDPLRLLVVQAVAAAFGAIPEIRRLVRLYALAAEVAADRHVVLAMGQSRDLANALLKTAKPTTQAPPSAGSATDRRVATFGNFAPMLWRPGFLAAVAIGLELLALASLLSGSGTTVVASLSVHSLC